MRILTNSPSVAKGFISIGEADENSPQTVIFCIPIDSKDAEKIGNIYDFDNYFSSGIYTKIKYGNRIDTISLDYFSSVQNNRNNESLTKFVANIKGHEIDFYLSPLNFLSENGHKLRIDFYYNGKDFIDDLSNKKLVIVEPNWQQLDKLFLEEDIVFTDWK